MVATVSCISMHSFTELYCRVHTSTHVWHCLCSVKRNEHSRSLNQCEHEFLSGPSKVYF